MVTKKSKLTQTTEKVGKALARSSFKAESASKAAKKKVENIVGRVTQRTQHTIDKVAKLKPPAKQSKVTSKPLFKTNGSLTAQEQIGLTAGDIYLYLQANGEVAATKVVNAMKRRKNSQAIAHAALGWLARENKLVFSQDGASLRLADDDSSFCQRGND